MYNHLYDYNQPPQTNAGASNHPYLKQSPYYKQQMPLRSQEMTQYSSIQPSQESMMTHMAASYNNPAAGMGGYSHNSSVTSDMSATLPPLNAPSMSEASQMSPKQRSHWPTAGDDTILRQMSSPIAASQSTSFQKPPVLCQMQQEEPRRDLAEVEPYGCDIPGCYASFQTASILFYHIKNAHPKQSVDKPYRCAIPGCTKRYKNVNGLQYHLRDAKGSSGHASLNLPTREADAKVYKCNIEGCKRAYRTANGLRYHQQHGHSIDTSMPYMHHPQQQGYLSHANNKWAIGDQ